MMMPRRKTPRHVRSSSLWIIALISVSSWVDRGFGFSFAPTTPRNRYHSSSIPTTTKTTTTTTKTTTARPPLDLSNGRSPKSTECVARASARALSIENESSSKQQDGLFRSKRTKPSSLATALALALTGVLVLFSVSARRLPFGAARNVVAAVAAAARNSNGNGSISIGSSISSIRWNSIARLFAICVASSSLVANIRSRRRQSRDATSEWQRYAENPGARGRAIMVLLTKQTVLIAASKIIGALPLPLPLPGLFSKLRRRKERAMIALRQYAGHGFSDGILKLGPLYIKLGQIVSCRPGLLGKEWVDALEDLQDKVPARTGKDARELAYSALEGGKEEFDRLFVDFRSTPLAAASLGQVHRARLRESGNEVAIKVQRPHLRTIYDQDFALLTTIAKWMDRFSSGSGKNIGGVGSSWTQIFDDAEEILYREIDYRDEADNAIRFANDFGLAIGGGRGNATATALARNNQSMPDASEWLRTPYIYANHSNERLLVQEYVPSIKITDTAKLNAANITEVDRIRLADDLARAYLRQFCCHLFFSTDPHPGNLGVELVRTDSSTNPRPRLVMYDFGQAASLTKGQADGILEIIEAIIDMDVDRSIEAFQKMEVLVDGADLEQVRGKVADNYRTGKVKANRKKLRQKGFKFKDEEKNATSSSANTTEAEYSDSQVMSYFTLPAEYAFVARAISQMDGVGKSLDPEFDFISSAAPFIVEIKGADLYLKDEVEKFLRSFQERITTCVDHWKKKLGFY